MHDYRPNALLDDIRKHTECGRNALVLTRPSFSVNVDRTITTGFPTDVGSMDSILNLDHTSNWDSDVMDHGIHAHQSL